MNEAQISQVQKNWQLLSLETNWDSKLKPLDNDLNTCIKQYAKMAQACYGAFKRSRGRFKFSEDDLFCEVGLQIHSTIYNVTKFISTTVFLKSVYDSAFVCVSTDECAAAMKGREIVISWRGTNKTKEWIHNFRRVRVKANHVIRNDNKDLHIHSGWLSMYTSHTGNHLSARDQVNKEVKYLLDKFSGDPWPVRITGHSLGAALAVISAADIVTNASNLRICPVNVIVFAQPRVGGKTFCKLLDDYKPFLRILRVENKSDIVPRLPIFGYHHVGTALKVKSNYVKAPNPITAHKIKKYLSNLDCTHIRDWMDDKSDSFKMRYHGKKKKSDDFYPGSMYDEEETMSFLYGKDR